MYGEREGDTSSPLICVSLPTLTFSCFFVLFFVNLHSSFDYSELDFDLLFSFIFLLLLIHLSFLFLV